MRLDFVKKIKWVFTLNNIYQQFVKTLYLLNFILNRLKNQILKNFKDKKYLRHQSHLKFGWMSGKKVLMISLYFFYFYYKF